MSVKKITADNFQKSVLESPVPVLLDFWATWCGPCRMLSPVIEEIAAERPDVIVGKVNVDEEYELAKQFKIISIPTVLVMKDGVPTAKNVGYAPKEKLLSLL